MRKEEMDIESSSRFQKNQKINQNQVGGDEGRTSQFQQHGSKKLFTVTISF